MYRLTLLAALVGCSSGKTTVDDTGGSTDDTGVISNDADRDGYAASVEWDDNDASVHPYATEAVRAAWTQVFGAEGADWRAYHIEPSDCGLAIWQR